MADTFTQLNPGCCGDKMDETGVQYPGDASVYKRPRVVIGGDNIPGELASVDNKNPDGSEYGLVTRPIVRCTNSNTNRISSSLVNTILLPANSARAMATIFNESSTSSIYLLLGTGASPTNYTMQIYPTGYYEVPAGYNGEIDAVWSVADASAAQVTELS